MKLSQATWTLLVGVCACLPLSAHAQATPKKKKVIRLDAITVEGRIQKPQAFYILQRSNLNFDELNRSESFVPKVLQTVDKEPF